MIPETLVGLGPAAAIVGAAGLVLAWVLQPPPRRSTGDKVPSPSPATAAPPAEAASSLDLGLALLASAPGARARVEAVLCGDEVFEALLAVPDLGPPGGFAATAEGKVWALAGTALLAPVDGAVRWPLLVAVGDTDAGRCHLNLQALGLVAISGPDAESLAARMASQLAERASRGEVELVVAGHPSVVLAASIPTFASCAEGLAALSNAGEGSEPRVLIGLTPPSGDDLDRLVDDIDRPGGLDGAVVVGDAGQRGWPLCAEVGQLVLERLALSLSPLPHDQQTLPADRRAPVTPAPSRSSIANAAEVSTPMVRVLGPVGVEGSGEPMGGKALELTTYLACHPGGVGDDRLQTALWPERMPARGTFNNLVSLARRQLGTDADGAVLLPHALERRYRLAPVVGCDLARLEALADQAGLVTGDESLALLVRALEVVNGRPFDEADGYEWAHREGLVAAAERRVVSVAHHLAEDARRTGDLERAEWAARQGLRAAPGDELLFRDRMLVAHAAGSTSAVESIMDELRSHLDGEDPLDALHPDTLELHQRLGQRRLARR